LSSRGEEANSKCWMILRGAGYAGASRSSLSPELICGLSPGSAPAGQGEGLTNDLTRIPPLVVVPTHHLDEIAVDDLRHPEVDNRRAGIFDDVGRDDGIRGHTEDPAITFAPRLLRKHTVHFIHRRRSGRECNDVSERANRDGRPDGHA